MTESIKGLGTYDKAKRIVNFVDKETKNFEKDIDRAILDIFERNGINIQTTDKSVLKQAFAILNRANKDIEIVDLYKNMPIDNIIAYSKNKLTITLDDDYLECGVQIVEKSL